MHRRELLTTLGVASGATAFVLSSGAFTSTAADRDVTVNVTGDATALLALRGVGPNSEYVLSDDGTIGLDLTGSNQAVSGAGVNTDAITVLRRVIEARNDGTQDVTLRATPLTFVETAGGETLTLLVVPTSGFPTVTLSPGATETFSIVVDDASPTVAQPSLSETITFTANA